MSPEDRELLARAARAAGMEVGLTLYSHTCMAVAPNGEQTVWNPLTDDGDALRLAATLNMTVAIGKAAARCHWQSEDGTDWYGPIEYHADSRQTKGEATRRAIVRAAAAMAPETPTEYAERKARENDRRALELQRQHQDVLDYRSR